MAVTMDDYKSDVANAWCPGCGNFGILEAVKQALVGLDLAPDRVLICTGIGQAPKLPHYMKVNTFNGLHGREIASAQAAKLAADDLTVIVHAGDGGAYGEGGNHLLHAIRRDVDITAVIHDNRTYGLTKGQASPTTEEGTITKIQPDGIALHRLQPLALAISLSCSFVAQGYAAKTDHLVNLLKDAINHKGFALINVLQPCVSWDHVHTYKYYEEHCEDITGKHDPTDRMAAFELVYRKSDRIPIGVIYKHDTSSYEDVVEKGKQHPLRDRGVDPEVVKKLYSKFR